MSTESVNRKPPHKQRSTWSSVSFIVESVLLLVFLVASLAVLTQVFSASLSRSVESRTLDAATIAATSIAEHFEADPTGVEKRTVLGDLVVTCDVEAQAREAGTLYNAQIAVYDTAGTSAGQPVYSISTSCYESEAR